ncbi:MAG TPA: TRAP transporter small permease subunit [Geminicoccaceae bacterium]|nr:TRAP transporter small permease subunit [Geminicoccaceae bacterium]
MIGRALGAIDAVTRWAGRAAMACALALTVSMLWEVVARYAFGAPTIWATDLSTMLNGAVLLLGAGYAVLADAHVRIDFLSSRLPLRVQHAANLAVIVPLLLPVTGLLTWVAAGRALRAYQRGEVDLMTSWRPLLWPFYGVIALGLAVLSLQLLARAVRHAIGVRSGAPLAAGERDDPAAAGPEAGRRGA